MSPVTFKIYQFVRFVCDSQHKQSHGNVWFTCCSVSCAPLCVLGGDLMDAITRHVALLSRDLKVTGLVAGGRMEAVFFSLLPSTCLFAVCGLKTHVNVICYVYFVCFSCLSAGRNLVQALWAAQRPTLTVLHATTVLIWYIAQDYMYLVCHDFNLYLERGERP